MSLRARFIFGYTVLLALVFLAFGSGLYFIVFWTMSRQVDQALQQVAQEILQPGRIDRLSDFQLFSLPPLPFSSANAYAQIWTADGRLTASSPNLQGFTAPLDPEYANAVQDTFSEEQIQTIHLRVLTKPISLSGNLAGYLLVGTSLNLGDRMMDSLLIMVFFGSAFGIGISILLGNWIARNALLPLEAITATALQITHADDLSRRIPMAAPPSSEVGRLILAFNETLERLETLFSAQSRFLADVSHELRTPLTAIRGNTDLIRRMGPDAESLDAIQSEVDRMIRMVGDLLMLSRTESGTLPMAAESVEMDTLLLEVFQQARILSQSKVSVEIGYLEQIRITGDRDRLKQLLLNIVTNALQYTPTGGRILLSLRRVEEWLHITVSDTGPGIPPDEMPHIFDRFYRLDRSRGRGPLSGAGLGLSIAQYIARAHHGRIEAASEVGKGTTFSIWLPLEGTQAPSETTPEPVQ